VNLIEELNAKLDDMERIAEHQAPWPFGPFEIRATVEAHREILAEHCEGDDGSCLGCGANYCEEPRVSNVNDCATLLALAKAHRIDTSGSARVAEIVEQEGLPY
jgi:hypothetical protein